MFFKNNPDKQRLQSSNCKKCVHYRCTLLPSYQIQRFISFGKGHSTYMCINCVEVPKYLQQLQPVIFEKYEYERKRSCEFQKEISTLKEMIEKKETEIREVRDALRKMTDITMPSSPLSKTQQKRRRINEVSSNEEIFVGTTHEDTEQDKMIDQLKKQHNTLSERLNERENTLNKAIQKLNEAKNQPIELNKNEQLLSKIETSIQERFRAIQVSLLERIDEKLKFDRRNESGEPLSYAEMTSEHYCSLKKPIQEQPIVDNFRSILTATRNTELAEQRDREKRACNIVLHGRKEKESDKTDVSFVKRFIQEVSGNISTKSIQRIGITDTNKRKPILITFFSKQDKEKIMNNLPNLKGKTDFKGISITEDYTISERQLIKEFRKTARDKNALELDNSNFIWKVRGNPRSGLIVKRFKKVLEGEL